MRVFHIINISWAVFEKILTILLTLITTGAISRYFGVELFGAYQYSLSVLFVVTSMTWLCPAETLFSKVTPEGRLENDVLVTSIVYRFFISALVWLGCLVYTLVYIDTDYQLAFILILTITILYTEPLGVFRFVLECQGQYHVTAKIRIFGLITKVFFTLLLIWANLDPILVLLPILAESFLVSVFCLYYAKKHDKKIQFNFAFLDKKIAKVFFLDGVKLWLGLLCMSLFLKLDRLILQGHETEQTFGLYTAAFSVLEQLISLSTMVVAVLGPVLIYRAVGNELKANTLKLSVLLFCVGLFILAVMYFLSKYFITYVYGEKYIESVDMFRKLVFVLPLVFCDSALNAFIIKNKSNIFFFVKWVVVLISSYVIIFLNLDNSGWVAGVYGYYTGFMIAVFMSLYYFFSRHEVDLVHYK
ncbi:hypothetical protein [Shewanella sp. Koi 1]